MSKRVSRKQALANPIGLNPFSVDKGLLRVVIETPKGSRNKFAFNDDERIFELKKVLPAGMTFPYDFGFVPSTKADDGDPVDVLVLMDEPAFAGCALSCRLIGVIQGEQGDKKKKKRNENGGNVKNLLPPKVKSARTSLRRSQMKTNTPCQKSLPW